MVAPTRRTILQGAAMVAGSAALPGLSRAQAPASGVAEGEVHGLSIFGELAYPPDFKHFAYVNPQAPKSGNLVLQLKVRGGNQNFDTFNTLNTFVLRGDGAAGMDMIYDTLMAGSGDDLGGMYGLVAKSVKVSDDRLTYRFRLRPEAKWHDGTRITAADVVFSINTLKEKGRPSFQLILAQVEGVSAEGDDIAVVKLSPERSRDLHLTIAGLPILPQAYWKDRDFEASTLERPLGSGAYKVGNFEQGRFIEFERVADYWAKDLPVNVGTNNFERVRYEYFRDRQVAFEAFKSGVLTFNEEYTARIWATGYDFPALKDGRVRKEELPDRGPASAQGWIFNTRREQFRDPRIREALGYAFDFEWTNKNIMFGAYKRTTSYFENSQFKAAGLPSAEELALLEPWRGKVPDAVFQAPFVPPVTDGSGQDRALLRKADELLRAAGCKRDGGVLKLPSGKPFVIEFLDASGALQPHTQPFQDNLKRLGIQAASRIIDAAQYQRRVDDYDFDVISRNMGGSSAPGDGLRVVYGSAAGKMPGGGNNGGIDDPAVDALIEAAANAQTLEQLTIACRALDRVLRSGFYWIPMWWNPAIKIAYWDMYEHPAVQPKYGTGAPGTWWVNMDKAKRIGRA